MSCIFCMIANKEIPSTIIYENDDVICFHDLKPVAPVHVLIVPKKHYDDILDLSASEDGAKTMEAILSAVSVVAGMTGVEEGFRLINNCRAFGGQTVMHVHFHLIGGIRIGEKLL